MGLSKTIKKAISHPERVVYKFGLYGLCNWMSDEMYLKLLYFVALRKQLNLKSPKTFNEKLQWLKIHDRNPLYTTLVDKYEVKKYIDDTFGGGYTIPCYGVWNSFDEIDFDRLPEQFVLKCTHDSGGVVICWDKDNFDKKAAKMKLERTLKYNFFYVGREWPYKGVKPRILAEQYLENNNNEGLHDYKVWCFNGKPKYIQYVTGRLGGVTSEAFYDTKWRRQKFTFHNPPMKEEAERPLNLEQMLDLAGRIAEGTSYVRCDFYVLKDGSVKFGEVTFFPMNGVEKWHPENLDLYMGKMLKLKSYAGTVE